MRRRKLTKAEVLSMFRSEVLPAIRKEYEQDRRVDSIARREEWSNFTDMLCKDGQIYAKQYDTWSNPF